MPVGRRAGEPPARSVAFACPETVPRGMIGQKREFGMLYLARLSTIAGATVVVTAAFIIAAVRVLLG